MALIYLIRHGIAAPRQSHASDRDRPLTEEGRIRTAACARGLARLACPKLFLTSPLARAHQTADLFAKALRPRPKVEVLAELGPVEDLAGLLKIVDAMKVDSLALVGHEPDMGRLISFLLAGQATVQVEFKRAAAARIDFEGRVAPGTGTLAWFLPPKVLEMLGEEAE